MTLYILCGIPGSGKTTLSRQLAEQTGAKLYCFDDIPGAHGSLTYNKVRQTMAQDIAKDVRNGLDVVCDNVNSKKAHRLEIINALHGIDCKKVLIVMDTSLDECLRRNRERKARLPDHVLYSIHKSFEPPSLDEGWDEIRYYK